jgi:hypothetical protein
MADDNSAQPEQPAEDEVLVRRVDNMMSAERRNPNPAPPQGPYQPKKAQATTAPPLSDVYKPKKSAEPPLVIKLADETPPLSAEPTPAAPVGPSAGPLDDRQTDAAVDDIAAKESDELLAVADARAARRARALTPKKPSWQTRLKGLLKNKWTWLGLVIVLIIVFALPFTRYKLLGLVLKKPVTITVMDSKNDTPVSNAEVQLGGASAKTNADGQARLKAPLGKHSLRISKQYYQQLTLNYFVGFKSPTQPASEKLLATGRLVPLMVINKITGQPLKGAEIKVKTTAAKTSANGKANLALPAAASSYEATVSLKNYNSASVSVQVTDQIVKANDFQLTPSGQIYFLSNASGSIDVVKANLDGSGRKTILAGTGHEDATSTVLLATRDWRYLVLEANRDGSQPALYLIDTSTDKSTEFEDSGAAIKLVGWYGHDFIYDLTKTSQAYWQPGREIIKSYDADNQQTNQLDQSQAEGSANAYAYQDFDNFYVVNGSIVYTTAWNTFDDSGTYDTTGKADTIRAVGPIGQNKKDYESFSVDSTNYIQAQPYGPQGVYFAVNDSSDGSTTYYDYENQAVKTASIDNGVFTASYPTYLVSPSGGQTFWSELLDGQNDLFTGDSNGNSKKQIASSGAYTPYGWYSNNYVLVSKDNSQLYIMPAAGLSAGQLPLKITDYYKPAQTLTGYGYGYGGL